jgi:hypothetical protein
MANTTTQAIRQGTTLSQPYMYRADIAGQKVIDPLNRNGHTILECLRCFSYEVTRKRFGDNPGDAQRRYRAWLKLHGVNCHGR